MPANATPGGAVATRSPLRAPSQRKTARRRSPAGFKLLLAAVVLYACGDSSVIGPSPANNQGIEGAQIALVSGDGQEGVVGSLLAEPLIVEVRDANGALVPDAPIAWEVLNGRGMASGQPAASVVIASTGPNGRASIQWELGRKAGVQQVSAEIVLPGESTSSLSAPSAAPSADEGPSAAPPTDRGKKIGFFANAKPDAISNVQLSPDAPTLDVGQSLQLQASAEDKWGNLVTLQSSDFDWATSDPAVAVVTDDGVVTATSDGEASIQASTSGVTGEEMVYVGQTATDPDPNPDVARIVASPETLYFSSIGSSALISVVAENSFGEPVPGVTLEFGSSNSAVAEVDAVGRVTSMAVGTAMITIAAVCCGSADTVAVQVQLVDPSQPGTFLFHSDWATATGATDLALLDLSKMFPWDSRKGTIAGGATIQDTVDWQGALPPGTHALTIAHVSDNDNPGVRISNSHLPAFTRGQRGYRAYLKNVLPDDHSIGSGRHPWQDAGGQAAGFDTNWEFNFTVNDAAGTYSPYWELPNSTCSVGCAGAQTKRWTIGGAQPPDPSTALPKDSVYRFEMLLIYHPTADSVRMEARIYNADGTLRNDVSDFKRVSDDVPMDRVIWYDAPRTANWSNHRDMQIGTNGWGGGTTTTPYVAWHWGGVAVCDGWCGPYQEGK